MKPLVSYLNFSGNCRDAMTFYKQCLGAELDLVTFGDMPHPGLPAEAKDLIMHVYSGVVMGPGSSETRGNADLPGQSIDAQRSVPLLMNVSSAYPT